MDIIVLKEFFMWCTIINAVLLILSFLMCAFLGNWVYKIHSKFYTMSKDAFNLVMYSYVSVYQILFLIFCLIPYVALLIIT
jgi:hypothetical protein